MSEYSIWDSVDVKADWFMQGLTPNKELNSMPSEFTEFYEKFLSEESFQKEHIAFEHLIAVEGHCDTTIRFDTENWIFTVGDFTEFFEDENNAANPDGWDNTFYFSPTKFYYQFRLKEIGWIYKTGFEKIRGQWYLTLYYVNSC